MIVVCRRSVADLTQMINTILAETIRNEKIKNSGFRSFCCTRKAIAKEDLWDVAVSVVLVVACAFPNAHYESKCDREPGGVHLPIMLLYWLFDACRSGRSTKIAKIALRLHLMFLAP